MGIILAPGSAEHPLQSPLDDVPAARAAKADAESASLSEPLSPLMRYMTELQPRINYLDPDSRARVLEALEVADAAHEGQLRKSGEPYIIHPVAVTVILADMGMDRDTLIAGLLHDTVEDTPMTFERLEELFGRDVRRIVEGETKFSKLAAKVHLNASCEEGDLADATAESTVDSGGQLTPLQHKALEAAKKEEETDKQAEYLRNMFLAMTEDVRVIIVKLADRLHNMRTLEHMAPHKQKKISKETLEFFAPLAHRLGMRRIKTELEDLSFKFRYPQEYRDTAAELALFTRRARFDFYLSKAEDLLTDLLKRDVVLRPMLAAVHVLSSTKELYAIYRKMQRGESLDTMLDVATLRVVVELAPDATEDVALAAAAAVQSASSAASTGGNVTPVYEKNVCYHILGLVHSLWKPLPCRVKDYIAFPKPNGYQSLHTTVLPGPELGFFPLEVQIRTSTMHRVAEEGIAAELFQAHPGRSSLSSSLAPATPAAGVKEGEWRRRTMLWLKSIREYCDEFSDSSRDLVDAVRSDLLGNRVFVFTPRGMIIDLPKDSTPVDVAYRIHSDIGHRMIGAKVNGRIVGLNYKLHNADLVKIITSATATGPSSDWVQYAKSRTARQKIRQLLRVREREKFINRGRRLLQEAARRRLEPLPSEAALAELLPRLSAVIAAATASSPTSGTSSSSVDVPLSPSSSSGSLVSLSSAPPSSLGEGRELREVRSTGDVYLAIAQGRRVIGVDGPDGGPSPLMEDVVLSLLRDRRLSVYEHSTRGVLDGDDGPTAIDGLHFGPVDQPRRSEREQLLFKSLITRQFAGRSFPSATPALPSSSDEADYSSSSAVGRSAEASRPRDVESESPPVSAPRPKQGVVELASCCHPVRGDQVMGVRTAFGDGLLSYVSGLVANCGKSIRRASTVSNPEAGTATLAFEILVEDTVELQNLLDCFRACDDILASRRVGPNESAEFFPFDAPPPHAFDDVDSGAGRAGVSSPKAHGRGRPTGPRGLLGAAEESAEESPLPESLRSGRRPPSPPWQYASNGTVSSLNGVDSSRPPAPSPTEQSDSRVSDSGTRGGSSTFAAQAHALGRHELQRSEVEIDGDAGYLASLEAASEVAARNGASRNGHAPVEAEPADVLDNLDDLDDE
ncbi:hypothetical protein I4F81_006394 [Pyropia yezoensis]|uniref:Uncharacterized protein n=1 Tax=Pyropia yezoensis TaxID=2788 RepID=A0ACC3C1G8_PYRYE|nr:hypothetical protein I4F81_006394 [Neopyropia yezoensis]